MSTVLSVLARQDQADIARQGKISSITFHDAVSLLVLIGVLHFDRLLLPTLVEVLQFCCDLILTRYFYKMLFNLGKWFYPVLHLNTPKRSHFVDDVVYRVSKNQSVFEPETCLYVSSTHKP